jgi:carboxymethylenebutenolidase
MEKLMNLTTLSAKDGFQLAAYVAKPEGIPRGAIVVVQEIFGVNSHIKSICDRLAENGYVAIAPAMFDRIHPGFESGYTPEEVARSKALMQNFNIETALLDLEAARGKVATAGNVGIVGFCLGGSLSWLAATRLKGFSGASSFYGGMVQQFATEVPKCPVQFHFGADDASIPPDNYEEVQKQHPAAEFYLYQNAGHGFNCDQRNSYAPEPAAVAWARTLTFFKNTLVEK